MSRFKRIAEEKDRIIDIVSPVNEEELKGRHTDYSLLTAETFAKKYRHLWQTPVKFTLYGKQHEIQYNHCVNPFCQWFSLPQVRFDKVIHKPYRYKLSGSTKHDSKKLRCNPDPNGHYVSNDLITLLSNWSIAEEIARLTRINHVMKVEPEYQFHKPICTQINITPFEQQNDSYMWGKSRLGLPRWKCKTCDKVTNIFPNSRESFTYSKETRS